VPAARRRAALCDCGLDRPLRGGRRVAAHSRHHLRRQGLAQGDRDRGGGRTPQEHRLERAQGHGGALRRQGLSAGLGEGAPRLGRRRRATAPLRLRVGGGGAMSSSTARARLEDEHAFVLHTYPFQDTSLIVEAFTRSHGRIGLVAKGARRPKSALRPALLAFQPLAIAWGGRGELRTLTRAESVGAAHSLVGLAMMCGYYVNELVLKLLQRDDPHERLFDDYAT